MPGKNNFQLNWFQRAIWNGYDGEEEANCSACVASNSARVLCPWYVSQITLWDILIFTVSLFFNNTYVLYTIRKSFYVD